LQPGQQEQLQQEQQLSQQLGAQQQELLNRLANFLKK